MRRNRGLGETLVLYVYIMLYYPREHATTRNPVRRVLTALEVHSPGGHRRMYNYPKLQILDNRKKKKEKKKK